MKKFEMPALELLEFYAENVMTLNASWELGEDQTPPAVRPTGAQPTPNNPY